MFNIEFEYRDQYNYPNWRRQSCQVSSVEECKKIYGLGVDCEYRIISVEGDVVTLMGDGNIAGVERCRIGDIKAVALQILTPRKHIDCMSRSHLRLAAIWKSMLPVRRWVLAVYRRIFI